jgi:hypothetical protein
MKKFLAFTILLLLATASGVFAETPVKTYQLLDRVVAEKAFEQLTKNAQQGLLAPNAVVQSKFAAIEDTDLPLPPTAGTGGDQPGSIPVQTGIKVWFERAKDGKLINPRVYRFSPGENFFVHVEAAVPVFITLFQNFPRKEGKDPVQQYPVQRFPSSYRILNPAESTKLPVKFALDDNNEAEYVSIVVARADWDEIAEYVRAAANTAVELAKADTPQGRDGVYSKLSKGIADISTPDVLTKFVDVNNQAGEWEGLAVDEEFTVVVPPRNAPQQPDGPLTVPVSWVVFRDDSQRVDVSNKKDDVANYLFSNTSVGMLQIVLNKEKQLAP